MAEELLPESDAKMHGVSDRCACCKWRESYWGGRRDWCLIHWFDDQLTVFINIIIILEKSWSKTEISIYTLYFNHRLGSMLPSNLWHGKVYQDVKISRFLRLNVFFFSKQTKMTKDFSQSFQHGCPELWPKWCRLTCEELRILQITSLMGWSLGSIVCHELFSRAVVSLSPLG